MKIPEKRGIGKGGMTEFGNWKMGTRIEWDGWNGE
jgi:hypothetical protein